MQVHVDLDRAATEEHKAAARRIFETTDVGVRGRYADQVLTLVEIATTIGLGASGSALWDFVKWSALRVKQYLASEPFPPDVVAVAIYRATSAGLTWEIRHRSDLPLGTFEAGVIIHGVNTWDLPKDAARVSINLIDQRVAVFDDTGLHVCDLDFPTSAQAQAGLPDSGNE